MPVCKNDKTAHYKGYEPSPKGRGYCAHAEREETIKKGLDGNRWIVSKGRWIKHNMDKEKLRLKFYKQ